MPAIDPTCVPPPARAQVLSAGRVELLAEAFGVGAARAGGEAGPAYMSLDGSAMENLEVRGRCISSGLRIELQFELLSKRCSPWPAPAYMSRTARPWRALS